MRVVCSKIVHDGDWAYVLFDRDPSGEGGVCLVKADVVVRVRDGTLPPDAFVVGRSYNLGFIPLPEKADT